MEEELHTLRLKLKAARALLRDLTAAVAQAEAALEANAQPKEAQRGTSNDDGSRNLTGVA